MIIKNFLKNKLLICLILVLAFVVRVWGINFGLPYFHHFDENLAIYTAFFAASHKLQPNYFLYPMLLPEILILLYGFYFLVGLLLNLWWSTFQFFVAFLNDPTVFLLMGRLFIATVGTISVWLTYFIGKKIYGQKIGLVGAFFLSLGFLHIQESHYIKEYILVGFLGLTAFYFNYLILKTGELKNYIFSGIILGLLFASKYYSFIFLPMLILSHLLKLEREANLRSLMERFFLIAISLSIITFFLLNPFILLFPGKAIQDISFQLKISGQWVSSDEQPVWLYYLTQHLRYGLGIPLLIFSLGGFIYTSIIKHQPKDLLLISTPISLFTIIIIASGQNFARYLIPIIPFLSLMAAIFVDRLVNLVKVD